MKTALTELGSGFVAARLAGALPRLLTAPRGDGHTVVDIPGWRAPELSGAPMRAYLRALGYDARGWGFGTNTGNPRRDVKLLTDHVMDLVYDRGSPVSLVGWSLGGVIAREVARQQPDAVRGVITYGTPLAGGSRFTGVTHANSPRANVSADAITERDAKSAIQVPLTVVFTRRDGIVAWQACLDRFSPYAEHVEVFSTHIGWGSTRTCGDSSQADWPVARVRPTPSGELRPVPPALGCCAVSSRCLLTDWLHPGTAGPESSLFLLRADRPSPPSVCSGAATLPTGRPTCKYPSTKG